LPGRGDDIADLIDRDIGKTAGTHQGRKLLAARLLTKGWGWDFGQGDDFIHQSLMIVAQDLGCAPEFPHDDMGDMRGLG
jgi:hypothetical protein